MKILITGKGSYIGTCFSKYIKKNMDDDVFELDTINEEWKSFDFSNYDVIFHVAGIAHQKETDENANLYYKVNRDLTYEIAKKAKLAGVKKFIFMSSMSVYGLEYAKEPVTIATKTMPSTHYGKSKLQAEELIRPLKCETFEIVILRPPMVYGVDSPGNMSKLLRAVEKVHIFPDYTNKRSSITINTLCIYVANIIHSNTSKEILFPQNPEYMCTSNIMKEHMKTHHKKLWSTKLFNPIIKFCIGKITIINKVFGDLYYEQ